jgi:hypothetical protein
VEFYPGGAGFVGEQGRSEAKERNQVDANLSHNVLLSSARRPSALNLQTKDGGRKAAVGKTSVRLDILDDEVVHLAIKIIKMYAVILHILLIAAFIHLQRQVLDDPQISGIFALLVGQPRSSAHYITTSSKTNNSNTKHLFMMPPSCYGLRTAKVVFK